MTTRNSRSCTLEAVLESDTPGIIYLTALDAFLVSSYLLNSEYSFTYKYLTNSEWYDTVHTFFLLVLEAEGR